MNDTLASRTGLPPALLELHREFARDGWDRAPGFHGLAAFWLDRHLGFRHLMDAMARGARARIDGNLGTEDWGRTLARQGGQLVNELIGHHQIEDSAYFPELARLEPRLARGFDLLDADHHALHHLIDRFVADANAVLQARGAREETGRFLDGLADFDRQLIRHLTDEEDLVIPVVLKHRVG